MEAELYRFLYEAMAYLPEFKALPRLDPYSDADNVRCMQLHQLGFLDAYMWLSHERSLHCSVHPDIYELAAASGGSAPTLPLKDVDDNGLDPFLATLKGLASDDAWWNDTYFKWLRYVQIVRYFLESPSHGGVTALDKLLNLAKGYPYAFCRQFWDWVLYDDDEAEVPNPDVVTLLEKKVLKDMPQPVIQQAAIDSLQETMSMHPAFHCDARSAHLLRQYTTSPHSI